MRFLVTGGSGFIGWYFHRELSARGHELVILDLHAPTGEAASAAYVNGDVRDPEALRKAMTHFGEPVDHVVHLAAAHHDFGISESTFFDVNETGAKRITEAMDELGITELTFYSTVAIYGHAPEPVTEDSPRQHFNPYGASKWAAEEVFQRWVDTGVNDRGGQQRRCLTIRPTVTFGPNNFANMYSLIRQVHGGKYVQFGPASNIKSLSYVENIVDATLYLWDHTARQPYDAFNWIDKPDFTSGQIAIEISKALGKRGAPLKVPYAFGHLAGLPFDAVIAATGKNLPISTARIHKLFRAQTKYESQKVLDTGFTPRCSLSEGIGRMVDWYLKAGKDQTAEWRLPPATVGKA
ncbi:MAG: NAD(P)-dependent oxidoreductase [Planctomycetota bacterium]